MSQQDIEFDVLSFLFVGMSIINNNDGSSRISGSIRVLSHAHMHCVQYAYCAPLVATAVRVTE